MSSGNFIISDKTDLPSPDGTEKVLVEVGVGSPPVFDGTYRSVELNNLPSTPTGADTQVIFNCSDRDWENRFYLIL